jgi:preprotein translocase subunit SecE
MSHTARVPVLTYLATLPEKGWVDVATIVAAVQLPPGDVNAYVQWAAQAQELEANELGDVCISKKMRLQFQHAGPAPKPAEDKAIGQVSLAADAGVQGRTRERQKAAYSGVEEITIREERSFIWKLLLGSRELRRVRMGKYEDEREKEKTRKFAVRIVLIVVVVVALAGLLVWLVHSTSSGAGGGRGEKDQPSGGLGDPRPKIESRQIGQQNEPSVPSNPPIPQMSDFGPRDLEDAVASAEKIDAAFWEKLKSKVKQVTWPARISKYQPDSDDLVHLEAGGDLAINAYFAEGGIAAKARQLPPGTRITIQGEIKMPYPDNHLGLRLVKCRYWLSK